MRSPSLALRLLVPGALVLLVATLATLQYRWLGQVSEAERDRLQASLRRSAEEMADDFDRELIRFYSVLQSDAATLRQGNWEPFATHLDAWRETAKFPQIARGVYLLQDIDSPDALKQYKPEDRAFASVPWPEALSPVRAKVTKTVESQSIARGLPAHATVTVSDPLFASIPALVVPMPSDESMTMPDMANLLRVQQVQFNSGYVIAHLDRDYLRTTVLPALVTRYFPEREADNFRFVVIDPADPSHPIYSRGVADGATLDPNHADWSVPIFALRIDLAQVMARTTALAGTSKAVMTKDVTTMVGSGVHVVAGAPPPPPPPPPVPMPAQAPRATGGSATSANFSIFVQQSGTTGAGDVVRFNARPAAAWKLVLQHTAGSLDAAVAQARRRNLWLSFGILAVLAAGVSLVVANAQRSQRLAAQQMDFVATVSHELRTPLTVIRSAAQNLSAGVVTEPSQAKRYGDLIETEGRRLTDMVEQVLEYAGLSGNRQLPRARLLDAASLIRDVVGSCSVHFQSERVDAVVELAGDLPLVVADEEALRRAVNNLLTNAIKYGGDGRWIGVSARRVQGRGGDEVQIAVSDRGRGIDPDDLPHIFEPFYRGRYAVDRQIQGNGLGLSLVKRIAEAHGGRVTVKSVPGDGATFTLHLPAARPDETLAEMTSSEPLSTGTLGQ